ncbi:MAG: MerR family transcriptional regulator [Pseudomonadota bacterium]
MSRIRLYSVGQLAAKSGVSVRTLHHYDNIGLLHPATRAANSRRVYDRDSVLRLQQILTYRTLGFPLDQIGAILDDPSYDRRSALLAQRKAVQSQIARNEALLRGIDEALALIEKATKRSMDMTTLFGGFDPGKFEEEAQRRWGDTDAWKISKQRTGDYSEQEWSEYNAANRAICERFAAFAECGLEPESPEVLKQVEAYRALIDHWFYPCQAAQMSGLADLYEGDARFRDSFDSFGPGTSALVIAAFRAFSNAKG